MDVSQYGMQIIREALESLLESSVASTVLLEALGHLPDDEELPADARGLQSFAHGPLAETLERHVGAVQTELTLSSLDQILGTALRAIEAGEAKAEEQKKRKSSQADTHALPDNFGPTRLLVIARSERLLNRIKAAVGAHRIAAASGNDIEKTASLRQALSPEVIVVDGQDAPNIDPLDLAAELIHAGEEQIVVIWATEQPWGDAVSRSLERQSATFVRLPRSEGVEPLIDYVRSRGGAG